MANTLDTRPLTTLLAQIQPAPPPPEGLARFLLLDLSPEAKEKLVDLQRRYSDRVNLETAARRDLAEAVASIEALVANGYPREPEGGEDLEVVKELDTRLASLQAARSKFHEASDVTAA
jgi:hypothetical protein